MLIDRENAAVALKATEQQTRRAARHWKRIRRAEMNG